MGVGHPRFNKLFDSPELLRPNVKPKALLKVNKNHPLAKDMDNFLFFPEDSIQVWDAAKGEFQDSANPGIDGTNLIHTQTDKGKGVAGASAHTGIIQPNGNEARRTDYTLLGQMYYLSNTQDHTLCQIGTSIAADNLLLWADTVASQLRPAAHMGGAQYGTANSIPINQWVTWGATIDATTAATPTAKFYIDGVLDSTTGDLGTFNTGGSVPVQFLNQNGGGRPTYGNCNFLARWNRQLSLDEIKSFTDDPYQILEPETYTIIPLPAAAGAFIAAWAMKKSGMIGAR